MTDYIVFTLGVTALSALQILISALEGKDPIISALVAQFKRLRTSR